MIFKDGTIEKIFKESIESSETKKQIIDRLFSDKEHEVTSCGSGLIALQLGKPDILFLYEEVERDNRTETFIIDDEWKMQPAIININGEEYLEGLVIARGGLERENAEVHYLYKGFNSIIRLTRNGTRSKLVEAERCNTFNIPGL